MRCRLLTPSRSPRISKMPVRPARALTLQQARGEHRRSGLAASTLAIRSTHVSGFQGRVAKSRDPAQGRFQSRSGDVRETARLSHPHRRHRHFMAASQGRIAQSHDPRAQGVRRSSGEDGGRARAGFDPRERAGRGGFDRARAPREENRRGCDHRDHTVFLELHDRVALRLLRAARHVDRPAADRLQLPELLERRGVHRGAHAAPDRAAAQFHRDERGEFQQREVPGDRPCGARAAARFFNYFRGRVSGPGDSHGRQGVLFVGGRNLPEPVHLALRCVRVG